MDSERPKNLKRTSWSSTTRCSRTSLPVRGAGHPDARAEHGARQATAFTMSRCEELRGARASLSRPLWQDGVDPGCGHERCSKLRGAPAAACLLRARCSASHARQQPEGRVRRGPAAVSGARPAQRAAPAPARPRRRSGAAPAAPPPAAAHRPPPRAPTSTARVALPAGRERDRGRTGIPADRRCSIPVCRRRWSISGMLYRKQGDLEQSDQSLQAAVERDADDADRWNELGVTLRMRGQIQGSRGCLRAGHRRQSATLRPRSATSACSLDLYLGDTAAGAGRARAATRPSDRRR